MSTNFCIEYIGQLEGEVATKVQEASELRQQNEQLREENNRLTDLTRMLLSSQAFSGFLQELSQSGLPANSGQASGQPAKQVRPQSQTASQSQPQPRHKDVSAHDASQQMHFQQPQIGMTLVPEVPVDLSTMQTSNGWMATVPTSDFQVYAVTDLPQGPVLDLESLRGKPTPSCNMARRTKDIPQLDQTNESLAPSVDKEEQAVDDSVVLDPDSFALYFTTPVKVTSELESTAPPKLVATLSADEQMAELNKMCAVLDESCARLATHIMHMQ